jgi:hypothetical protein
MDNDRLIAAPLHCTIWLSSNDFGATGLDKCGYSRSLGTQVLLEQFKFIIEINFVDQEVN